MTATLSDSLQVDVGSDGQANPGDTLGHTLTVENAGASDASGLEVNVSLDVNATLVSGSINVSPLALDDSHTALAGGAAVFQGNSVVAVAGVLTVADPASGLFANDREFLGDPFTLTSFSASTSQLGSVAVSPDGTFTYAPPAGLMGADTFTYTITDGAGLADSATVSIQGGVVLTDGGMPITVTHVDGSGTVGSGTFEAPFGSLTDAVGALTDIVYVHADSAFTGQTYALAPGQRLLGEGGGIGHLFTSDQLGSSLLPPGSGGLSRPVIQGSPADAVTVSDDAEVANLQIDNSGASGVVVSGLTGSATLRRLAVSGGMRGVQIQGGSGQVTLSRTTVTDAAVAGVDVDGGTATVDITAMSAVNQGAAGSALLVQSGHAGALVLSSDSTVDATAGDGLQFDDADGSYVFQGAVTLNGGDAGIDILNASDGTFTFASTDVTNPTGTGVNVDGGTAQVTFDALEVTTSGAGASGVRVVNSGLITVNGPASVESTGGPMSAISIQSTQVNASFERVVSDGSVQSGILLSGVTAGSSFTVTGTVDVDNSGGDGIDISTSSGTFTFASVDIDNTGGGGVTLTGNTGATANFNGPMTIDTTTGAGFTATGGGTVNVSAAAANTINTTTGTGLTFQGTDIGAGGVTFRSISVNGAANGIVLDSTGAAGGLTVTGDGSMGARGGNASGGTIANTTGDGIALTSTVDVTLRNVTLDATGGEGIDGTGVDGLALTHCTVSGAGNGDGESALEFDDSSQANLTGTVTIADCIITEMSEHGLSLENFSGTAAVTIARTTFQSNIGTLGTAFGGDGILLRADGTSTITVLVDGCDLLMLESDGVDAGAEGSSGSTLNLTVRDSSFTGAAAGTMGSGTGSDNALSLRTAGSGAMRFTVDNCDLQDANNSAVILQSNDTSDYQGFVTNSTIGTASVADSGSVNGRGIDLFADDNSAAVVEISGNSIRGTDFEGIFALSSDGAGGSPSLDVAVSGNTVATPDDNSAFPLGFVEAIRLRVANMASLCGQVADNAASAGVGGASAIDLTQSDSGTSTFEFEQGASASGTPVIVLGDNNPGSASFTAGATISVVANGTCATPVATPLP